MSSPILTGVNAFNDVPLAPPDAIFHLTASYKADTFPQKVNVGVGAYRDNQGNPWVLPVIRKVEQKLAQDSTINHEYLPIEGLSEFNQVAAKLILGESNPLIQEKKALSFQSLSGTGALRLGADFLARYVPKSTPILISNPTWINHKNIFMDAGFSRIEEYRYFDAESRGLNLNGMLQDLKNSPNGSIVVLHVCAHNPTGVDPNESQWKEIAEVMLSKQHFPFFDCAYQGFASGDIHRDALAVRLFSTKMEFFVAQSFAKNFGLYGERIGALTVVCNSKDRVDAVYSQLCRIQRAAISNPPSYGARLVSTILKDPNLMNEWIQSLQEMSSRIRSMREALQSRLLQLKTPLSWQHILDQIGMFSFTGLTAAQSKAMCEKFHIYMTSNGRISMAGLNTSNIQYFAESMDWVVRNVS